MHALRQRVITKKLFSTARDSAPVVVSFSRTPIGNFNGGLSSLSATQLGSLVIKSALEKASLGTDAIEEIYMGNVVSSGLGQAPATQASIGAGLSKHIPSTTINKVCASGMKSVMLASMSISSGYRSICLAGGMESMSNIPYYLPNARQGYRLGNQTVVDGLIHDGLWDPYSNSHMGNCGDLCATQYSFDRADLDEYAILSNLRATEAWTNGKFTDEVIPVSVTVKGKTTVVSQDEGIASFEPDKMVKLK